MSFKEVLQPVSFCSKTRLVGFNQAFHRFYLNELGLQSPFRQLTTFAIMITSENPV